MEDLEMVMDIFKEGTEKALRHLEDELVKIRAGKATPIMLDSVQVDYYGSNVPISQVANINTLDARTLTIQPWEKAMMEPIERSIINSNLGFAPQNNGEQIIISIPSLTEERRLQLVKQAKAEGENAKVSIRNARRDANEEVKKLQKDGIPEDTAKRAEDNIQDVTNAGIKQVDDLVAKKEKDIMTV